MTLPKGVCAVWTCEEVEWLTPKGVRGRRNSGVEEEWGMRRERTWIGRRLLRGINDFVLAPARRRKAVISADRQPDLACQWLYADQAADVGCLGGRCWTGRWRAQIEGRWGRMTCPPAWTDSDGVKAICVASAARQAGRSVRGARAAVRGTACGARGTVCGAVHAARGQNLNCVDVDKAAPAARGRAATRRRACVPSAD